MTIRDEEILNASTIYHEEQCHCDGWNYDFIEGAKWADQHPRKGLWDAEKVIEWLNSVDFSNYVENLSVVYVGQLKHDLIKAMED